MTSSYLEDMLTSALLLVDLSLLLTVDPNVPLHRDLDFDNGASDKVISLIESFVVTLFLGS